MTRHTLIALLLVSLLPTGAAAQVSFERLLRADEEPENWLTYSGSYKSQRHSQLDQITPANVTDLELRWVFQARSLEVFQATPLVVDGIMYLVEPTNTVVALDAKLGRVFWTYEYTPSRAARPCCGAVNRGLAILDNPVAATIGEKGRGAGARIGVTDPAQAQASRRTEAVIRRVNHSPKVVAATVYGAVDPIVYTRRYSYNTAGGWIA